MRSPSAPSPVGPRTRAERLANALSYLLNPLVFPPIAFALMSAHFGGGALEVAWVFAVSLLFFGVVPLLYILGMVRQGRAESLEVRDRTSRTAPLVVGVASYVVGIVLLGATTDAGTTVIVAYAALYPLNVLFVVLITLRWKISIHMIGLGSFVGGLLFVALTAFRDLPPSAEAALTLATTAPLLILMPLLMWARVRARAHTVGQVLAGGAFGLLVPVAELYVLTYHVLDLA